MDVSVAREMAYKQDSRGFHDLFAQTIRQLHGGRYIWGGFQTALSRQSWERTRDPHMKELMRDRIGVVGSDCSGTIYWAFQQLGLGSVGRRRALEYFALTRDASAMFPGTLNFYHNGREICHVNVHVTPTEVLNASINSPLASPHEVQVLPVSVVNAHYASIGLALLPPREFDMELLDSVLKEPERGLDGR